jgi:cytochrome c oxidase subunit 2
MKTRNNRLRFILISIAVVALIAGAMIFAFGSPDPSAERVIQITAKKFDFSPGEIKIKKGETVILELKSADRDHGFNLPDFKIRMDVKPGEATRVKLTPDKTGTFTFTCDVFCGSGHEDMSGTITVTD